MVGAIEKGTSTSLKVAIAFSHTGRKATPFACKFHKHGSCTTQLSLVLLRCQKPPRRIRAGARTAKLHDLVADHSGLHCRCVRQPAHKHDGGCGD